MIGYQTNIASKQASFPKGTSVNVLTTVNTTSLDQIICCLQPADTPISKLQLAGTNNDAAGLLLFNYLQLIMLVRPVMLLKMR